MPAVGMRRSTRVFGTRVLRSGRRLWEAGPGEVGKQQHYTRAADNVEEEWIDLLDNSGDERIPCKENGRHDDIFDLRLETKMDIDENIVAQPDGKTEKRWGAVYQRKRKRLDAKTGVNSLCNSDRMYGKQFFRKQGRKRIKERSYIAGTCNLNSGVVGQDALQGGSLTCQVLLTVLQTSSCGSRSFGLFSCFLNSILSYMSRFSLILQQLSAFLYSQPISNVFSSHGIHFLQDCTSVTSSGFCKIFGSRSCIPLIELDFSAAPFVFQYLHSSLLLRSSTLPCALVLYWNGMVAGGDNTSDGEELWSCIPFDGDNCGSRIGVSENSISEKRRRALHPSSTALKSVSRNLQLKNSASSRIIKKRRRSLRSRRGRNILPFVVRKANGTLLANLPSRYAGIPFPPVTSNHELISPIQGDFTTNIKELKSTLIQLTEDIDTSSCITNILVIESDKCYREEGATVTVEKSASNQWFVVIKRDGITKYSLMAQQVMRPCSCNRVTHAIIWAIDNGWKLEFPNRRDWSIFKKLYKECSDHNVCAPTVSVIPVPGVLEVSSYDDSNAVSFKRPQAYITWKDNELTRALTKGTANYDLDSDDEAWLNIFNNEILPENELDKHVTADVLELIINSFEKGFYCGEDDYSDVRTAVDLCKNLERREVLEAVHSYWMKKRKHKRLALTRVFQCYQPRRAPILPKVILRKKRSFQRQANKAGRDMLHTFLRAERDAEDEQKIIVKIQEAKAAANKSEGVAVLKRKRTQMLMETADLATYKATMALRIAQAVQLAEPQEVAASFFLD